MALVVSLAWLSDCVDVLSANKKLSPLLPCSVAWLVAIYLCHALTAATLSAEVDGGRFLRLVRIKGHSALAWVVVLMPIGYWSGVTTLELMALTGIACALFLKLQRHI